MGHSQTGLLPAPGLGYEQAFEYADRFNLDHVEVYAEGEPWREGSLSDPAHVRELLDRYEIELTAHLPFPIDIGSPMEPVREASLRSLDAYVEAVSERGGGKAVLHLSAPSQRAANLDDDETRAILIESAREATDIGREHGVEICAENLFSSVFTIEEFPKLLEETKISMTLDTGHAALTGWDGEQTASFIRKYSERISHVHLNDNRALGDGWRTSDEHLPIGVGTIDFETILKPVVEGEWSPTLTMEIVTWDEDYIELSAKRLHELLSHNRMH